MVKTKPHIVVIDDDDATREAVCHLAASVDMTATGYPGCRAFLRDRSAHDCDCLILDIRLRDGNGLQLHEQLTAAGDAPPVIFISGFGDIPMVVQAMRQGALDFLEKPFGSQALLDRIHSALAHSTRRRRERSASSAVAARIALLTPREREVMELMTAGRSSKDIGRILGISVRTAEHHRARVRAKMGVATIAALVALLGGRHQ